MSPNRSYRSGIRLEYLAAKELREAGYLVIRSAGSHSPFDLVCIRKDGIRLIQVKGGELTPGVMRALSAEMDTLRPRGAMTELWVRKRGVWHVYGNRCPVCIEDVPGEPQAATNA